MKLAILPRYIDVQSKTSMSNEKHFINHDFELMAHKLGVGLCSILSPYESEDFCSICDGLIIPGSNNRVNPSYYGGEPLDPPPVHDDFALDIKIIDYFAKNGKPILGICAGHQAINIYFGGTLGLVTEDGTTPHIGTPHMVNVKEGSFIHGAFESERVTVNSYHMRKIDRLADSLEVTALSDDGIIEAVQHKDKKIFGVQWHPEVSFRGQRTVEWKIFENFLECCKK